jgi:N,N'-diacetyllegionaminate synthase
VIAEAGVNHNGDLDLAKKLVDAAAEAGADAVKFQTFSADRLVTRKAPKAEYQKRRTDASESQYDMLKKLELSEAAQRELQARCQERGILFLSTPFDEQSADFLERLGVPAFKIPSGEITNAPFLAHVARKGRPMIVSTGMSTLEEVKDAVDTIRTAGNPPLVLLHCVSNYPADPRDVNLRAMSTLAQAFGVPVGYSDHTLGVAVGIAAMALGACVLEKHLTMDRSLPGPDHCASLEPRELMTLVCDGRNVELSLGNGIKMPTSAERELAAVARKSLVAARDLRAGTILQADMLVARRPGCGLPPSMLSHIVGKRTGRHIREDELLRVEDLQ